MRCIERDCQDDPTRGIPPALQAAQEDSYETFAATWICARIIHRCRRLLTRRKVRQAPDVAEITFIPAGALLFTENSDASAPSFGNYQLGGAVTYNLNRFLGVEGEVTQLDRHLAEPRLRLSEHRENARRPQLHGQRRRVDAERLRRSCRT